MRVVGYLVVLALIAGYAVAKREGQKLGAYFGDGQTGVGEMVAGPWFALTLACYPAAILILTSQRVRLTRPVLRIAIGSGTLTGVALWARYSFHLWSGVKGMLMEDVAMGSWGFCSSRLARSRPNGSGMLSSVDCEYLAAAIPSDRIDSEGATQGSASMTVTRPERTARLGSVIGAQPTACCRAKSVAESMLTSTRSRVPPS